MSHPPSVAPAPRSADRFYHPELDVLRFFAFAAVFLHHTIPNQPSAYLNRHILTEPSASWVAGVAVSGAYGVDLFFVLSAYLITTLLLREQGAYGVIDVRAFYVRRILRIWPLYFFMLAIALVAPHFDADENLTLGAAVPFVVFCANWFLSGLNSIAVPLWSVSMEEQFYLAWPWAVRLGGRRGLGWIALLLLVVAHGARVFVVVSHQFTDRLWNNTLTRLDPIALGVLLALLLQRRSVRLGAAARIALTVASVLVLVLVGRYAQLEAAAPPAVGVLVGYPAIAFACVGIFLATFREESTPSSSILLYLGRISYGLYVFQKLGMLVARHAVPSWSRTARGFALHWVVGLAATGIMAALSYRFLEKPFLRWKGRFTHVASR